MIVTPIKEIFDDPLQLESGKVLPEFEIIFETYGELAPERDNAILICHGLTSDHHAAGRYAPDDPKPGWWDGAIGPGKPFDTDRFCIISSNVIGGFGGSSGPASTDPSTGKPYAMGFPVVTIADMVSAQVRLADRLEIERFHTVAGGCMGGFQALEWLAQHPARLANALVISATARVSAHTIALWKVMREAIYRDPNWRGGDYYDHSPPVDGIAFGAMIGALFWMSRDVMSTRFGTKIIEDKKPAYTFKADFEIEAFMNQIAEGAASRIDPNGLMYSMRAMDYFDMTRGRENLAEAFSNTTARSFLVSYGSDWRYPSSEMEEIHQAIKSVGATSKHKILKSDFGHGAFIYDFEGLGPVIRDFLS